MIDNSDWEEKCQEDTLPDGDGIGTKKSKDENRKKEISDWEKETTKKHEEFSKKLDKISEKRSEHEEFYRG